MPVSIPPSSYVSASLNVIFKSDEYVGFQRMYIAVCESSAGPAVAYLRDAAVHELQVTAGAVPRRPGPEPGLSPARREVRRDALQTRGHIKSHPSEISWKKRGKKKKKKEVRQQ